MQLTTIVTALLLPLVAVATPPGAAGIDDFTTTTLTSYVTLTQTVTLERAAVETFTASKNGTGTFTTGAPSSKITTTAASALPTGGAAALGASNAVLVAIAGVFAAALL
jgi:hypothetical protein